MARRQARFAAIEKTLEFVRDTGHNQRRVNHVLAAAELAARWRARNLSPFY